MSAFELEPAPLTSVLAEAVIPLATAKSQVRDLDDDEDDLIEIFRDAAIEAVERYTMRLLARRMVIWRGSLASGEAATIGTGRIARVVSGSYLDSAGASQPFATTGTGASETVTGIRIGLHGRIEPIPGGDWPGTDRSDAAGAVTLQIEAGYADAASVPRVLIQAALLMIGHLFENREAVATGSVAGELPLGFTALCDKVRIPAIG